MKFQELFESLQPYVIGIRYLEGTPLLDVVFKEGWLIPEDKNIKQVQGDTGMNYCMLYSDVQGIGLDELFEYVKKVINSNIEREKKSDFLKVKFNELKEIFKKHSLNQLQNLKFTFGEEEEFDVKISDLDEEVVEEATVENIPEQEQVIEPESINYLDENRNPIELSEEELELIEEENRAKRNLKINQSKKINKVSKIELPKRITEAPVVSNNTSDCICGPDEACSKCIDTKY